MQLGADGVEISAHGFCAPDHEDIQGKRRLDGNGREDRRVRKQNQGF